MLARLSRLVGNVLSARHGYGPVQQSNILRLATVIWGPASKDKIVGLFRHQPSAAALDTQLNNLIGSDRFGSTTANPMYHMVQEAVESYNLGANLRNMARMSVRARTAGRNDVADAYITSRRFSNANKCSSKGTELKSDPLDLLIRARMLRNCTCSHRAGSDSNVSVAAGKRRCIHVWLIVRAIVR